MTPSQKTQISNYVLDLIGLIEQEELQFEDGCKWFKTNEDELPILIRGQVVKNSDCTFGVVKYGLFYEGAEITENGVDILEMLGEPTRIEELI